MLGFIVVILIAYILQLTYHNLDVAQWLDSVMLILSFHTSSAYSIEVESTTHPIVTCLPGVCIELTAPAIRAVRLC